MHNPLYDVIQFLKQTDELSVASTLLKTFKKYSKDISQYDQLGMMFNEVKDYHSAIDCAHKTLVLATHPEQMRSSRANLAKMYNHVNQPDKSLQYSNANLTINPQDYEAKMEKVFSLYLKGDLVASHALTKEILEDQSVSEDIRNRCLFNLGSYQMDEGNFREGVRNFIKVGHDIGIWKKFPLPFHEWDGVTKDDTTIVILAEGGIGDEIINVRFMKKIEELGMKAVWVTNRPELVSIFTRNGFNSVLSIKDIKPETHNVECCLSFFLPILLNLDKDQLWDGTYLTPDKKYVEKWKGILPEGKKVALRRSGNPFYEQDLCRSLTPEQLINSMGTYKDEPFCFVSVQKDYGTEITYDKANTLNVFDAAPYLETLEDLLACLSLCDLTLTSCTSVAHVAASSGNNMIVFPPIACYYTWLGREDNRSDWYGNNCRVIRQTNWRDYSHLAKAEQLIKEFS